jgi:hypothetical protein
MPTGEIVLQPPPQLEQHEGASGVLMNAIPMLGSLGSIVLVAASVARGGGRSYLAAACSCSPRSASSSCRSTGSGSSARSR